MLDGHVLRMLLLAIRYCILAKLCLAAARDLNKEIILQAIGEMVERQDILDNIILDNGGYLRPN